MLNKLRKLQNKKGFTLVELIVVIAIIAILTAVIVPLVGRYSAQATYTTLQDGAKTVANSIDNVISDVTKMGTVPNVAVISGEKTSGGLTISVDGSSSGLTGAKEKIQEGVKEALESAIPVNATFYCTVKANTISATIYSTDSSNKVNALTGSVTLKNDPSFDEAYQLDAKGSVGLQGGYKDKVESATADSDKVKSVSINFGGSSSDADE